MTERAGLFDFKAQKANLAALFSQTDWADVALFVGPNAERFRSTWEKMKARVEAGGNVNVWGFCWPALFLTFAWFFYRKLWAAGLVVLILPTAIGTLLDNAPASVAAMIALAMYAKSFYLLHAVRRIGRIRGEGGGDAQIAAAGGISIPGAIAGGLLLLLGLAGFVLSVMAQVNAR
jgi:hypothetical protein